jgi:hypothetical protein
MAEEFYTKSAAFGCGKDGGQPTPLEKASPFPLSHIPFFYSELVKLHASKPRKNMRLLTPGPPILWQSPLPGSFRNPGIPISQVGQGDVLSLLILDLLGCNVLGVLTLQGPSGETVASAADREFSVPRTATLLVGNGDH